MIKRFFDHLFHPFDDNLNRMQGLLASFSEQMEKLTMEVEKFDAVRKQIQRVERKVYKNGNGMGDDSGSNGADSGGNNHLGERTLEELMRSLK